MRHARPVFKTIEIETVNVCNGKCMFCPVSSSSPYRRKTHVMEYEIFEKIINDLVEMNYQGAIALYSNNEPFIDKTIVSKMKYVRSLLPDNVLYLYTNGSLLDKKKGAGIFNLFRSFGN